MTSLKDDPDVIQPKSRIIIEVSTPGTGVFYAATAEEWDQGTWVAVYEGDGPDPLAAVMDLARVMHVAIINHHEANH